MGIKTMTPEQAKAYVKAGFFPDPSSHQAVCDLQDAFGHLPYDFNVGLLADEEIGDNAYKLFNMIWDYTMVCSMLVSASDYRTALQRRDEVVVQMTTLAYELTELNANIDHYQERFAI